MASNQLLAFLLQGYESSRDDAEPQNNLHNQIPLPSRLEEEVFDSPDAIIEFINNFAQNHGYAFFKRWSKRAKSGHIKTVFVKCSLGGEYHNCMIELSTYLAYHRRQILEHATQIKAQLENGIDTCHIMASLVKEHGDNIGIKEQDIYNFRRNMRNRFLNGREPIHVLLSSFLETGDWVVNYQTHEDILTVVFLTIRAV
ncbi:hypothetical protein TSTA_044020 [Talaromyces stipitatus ATCC 10500]|uniref:Uncharacterized protein n=1 Tax=Talaromyces stipitatus (strain ATCC 10500 / CBS 375.48 / QM 6759 / NRRL 1006) TaxID=441959 RepID=B8MKT6_TALSN|nr:uncharacterized protein TSTA_044020 [Talaromyces stipitatus ATCC 10500]EED14935.1 hypothetical protein TSTA_044020 [Talaromyces stipitatus ATCC 10500]